MNLCPGFPMTEEVDIRTLGRHKHAAPEKLPARYVCATRLQPGLQGCQRNGGTSPPFTWFFFGPCGATEY
jgi:hypothetical protein